MSRKWRKVGSLGELQDGFGNSLVYGEFGRDTWGLYTTIDGVRSCIRVPNADAASKLLDKLETGWRPTNWKGADNAH